MKQRWWSDAREYITDHGERRPGGCWIWNFALHTTGYGMSQRAYGSRKAHRVSYAAFNGPIPAGALVCHSCDTPSCVNPQHLFLGTPKDNTTDALRKGRLRRGSECGRSSLTNESVLDIRMSTDSLSVLAGRYRVSKAMVSKIRRGEAWKHVSAGWR